MSSTTQSWPYVRITKKDQEIVRELQGVGGVLVNAETREVLMIAAALAVELDLPELLDADEKPKVDIINNVINTSAYEDYRQYMLLIYYLTAGERDLNCMNDFKAIVDNFIHYAHIGLQYLKMEYNSNPDGAKKLNELFEKYLEKHRKATV